MILFYNLIHYLLMGTYVSDLFWVVVYGYLMLQAIRILLVENHFFLQKNGSLIIRKEPFENKELINKFAEKL